jgi:aspartyl-tRNA(Asn)/glutamyl-tRNA(Gln) amidotransferase subunit B
MKYIPVIGMEVHVELKTKSKMFCSCKNGLGAEKQPNVHICPVCTGQPGTLPVPNRQAIEFVQLCGLALNCELNLKSKFDRKNYFYPDLPKGYQISQYDQPLCLNGNLDIQVESEKSKISRKIGITRIHLEEDTGKLTHPTGADYTLVDLNRACVPLMELVTEPDIESGEEARIFCTKLQQICRYLGISDADMEKGNMRCEVNLSLHKEGEEKLSGTKVEVKNINSFKFVEKAINYEIQRQTEVLESGEKVLQETRGWDSVKNVTVSQRKKESAHDYRYFPEPDIPPLEFDEAYVAQMKLKLPEMPDMKAGRFSEEYALPVQDVETLTSDRGLADYFENVVSELEEKVQSGEAELDREKVVKLAANYVISELRKHLIRNNESIAYIKVTPENFAELIGMVASGKINSSAAQTVLEYMYHHGGDPSQIVEEKNLAQTSDAGELESIADGVLTANEKSVTDYKAGKENALKFLMGQVMKGTGGKANPQVVMDILKNKLK